MAYGGINTAGPATAITFTPAPPIAIYQNTPVVVSEAIMIRIIKLHFVRSTVTAAIRTTAALLNSLEGTKLSNFLLQAVRKEPEVMELFANRTQRYEAKLRSLHSHCFACETPFKDEQE